MSGAAFLRLKKLKGGGIVRRAARHNRRDIQSELGATGSIDPSRSHLNETLCGPPSSDEVANVAAERLRAIGATRIRKDAVVAIECVFSLHPGHELDDREFFLACLEWIGPNFGGSSNVLSADIHRDETAPHCHVLLSPILDGRMAGSDLMGGPKRLQALQRDFHDAVASRFGLRRPLARLRGPLREAAAREVIERLRSSADMALGSVVWPQVREAIERDPADFACALGVTIQARPKPMRTMTQIFTSPGKGKQVRDESHIGFAQSPMRTQCSVGFRRPPPGLSPEAVENQGPQIESAQPQGAWIRERESDFLSATFDPVTGEFISSADASAGQEPMVSQTISYSDGPDE